MALADYRLCDICGSKVFYDANIGDLRYGSTWNSSKEYNDYVIGLGTLCTLCVKTHEVVIVEKANPQNFSKPKNATLYKNETTS